MASALFKFYVDGFLKQFNLEYLVKRNTDGDLLNIDNQIMWAKTRMSPDDVAAEMTSRLWVKAVAEDISELWVGSRMICRFDSVNGNLLFGFNDISTLPLEKGGTGYVAVGANDAAKLANLLDVRFGLKSSAYKDAGLGADNVLLLAEANKLPIMDGSQLTGIFNISPGQVAFFAQNFAPTGWLKCNGAQVSRVTYATLFANIGETWGAGNGTTTFALPDLRGEFPRFWDDGRGIDTGRAFASAQSDLIKNHTHTYFTGTGEATTGSGRPANAQNGGNYQTLSTNNNVGGGTETRPRNVALLGCIKY